MSGVLFLLIGFVILVIIVELVALAVNFAVAYLVNKVHEPSSDAAWMAVTVFVPILILAILGLVSVLPMPI